MSVSCPDGCITKVAPATIETQETLLVEQIISLVEHHLPNHVVQWHHEDAVWSFSLFFPRLEFRLRLERGGCIKSEIIDTYFKIARTIIDPLRVKVRGVLALIDTTTKRRDSDSDVSAVLLQALETVADFERAQEIKTVQAGSQKHGWSAEDTDLTWEEILKNAGGLDLSSVKDTAFHLLGKTPEQLCAGIPSAFRIIHIESVLRPDLARDFMLLQNQVEQNAQRESTTKLRKKLPPHSQLPNRTLSSVRREDFIKDMSQPRITYHGTPLHNVASIVRHGFRMPGVLIDGKLVASPRSGIAFNRGIYSSQAPHYALSYASGQKQKTPLGEVPSMRLFVCATVMGRTYRADDAGRSVAVHGPLQDGYDAHFDGSFEYIVHDKRAMLPCYVIHLDLGAEAAQRALREAQENPFAFEEQERKVKRHRRLEKELLAPGDVQRRKEAKKAAALKWFPYGFGSASGTKFVIEEVGEVSDDEEDYGEWQEARHGYGRDDKMADEREDREYCYDIDENGETVKKKRGPLLDQYQGARKARARRDQSED